MSGDTSNPMILEPAKLPAATSSHPLSHGCVRAISMHKERYWVGVAVCVVPLALALTALGSSSANGRNNPVEGYVSIRGRPWTGGYIVFVPDDRNLGEVSGRIDQNGHYAIRSSWWRAGRRARSVSGFASSPNPVRSRARDRRPARIGTGSSPPERTPGGRARRTWRWPPSGD